ncbi:uncharacterized protein LOC119737231 [Patiria miniata]|uniref:Uncharacterized protein n=1 Tax=Patiria miniata TaxID=46514 RepID=A0A914AUL2_PATMI|nr:uncharacterized protein LOC119737231 [Patiria miniata]XP_038067349.1 uncharacterized protein LOC119737231 [Patiria miniata]
MKPDKEEVYSEESPLLSADSKMDGEKTRTHDVLFICMSVLVTVMLIGTLFLNFLSGSIGIEIGWFLNGTGDISDYYYLEITPAGWTFSIWGIIYTFQVLFILYLLISLCRRNDQGPVYREPPVMNSLMLGLYSINLALNMSWLFLWDRQLMPVALVVIALLPFTLFLALIINHRLVYKSGNNMKNNHRIDLYAVRIIIQNGMALYATWVTIATLLNFAIVLSYWGGMDQSDASTVSLSVLLVEVLVYFALENIFFDKYLRYTYTVWMVVIFALTGSLAKNYTAGKRNSIFSLVLICLAAALFLVKIALSVWRALKRPLYTNQVTQSKQELAMA